MVQLKLTLWLEELHVYRNDRPDENRNNPKLPSTPIKITSADTLATVAAAGKTFWRNDGCLDQINFLGVGIILAVNNTLFKAIIMADNSTPHFYYVALYNSNKNTKISTATVYKVSSTVVSS